MPRDVLELAERIWSGELDTTSAHPVTFAGDLVEVADGVCFVPSFANVSGISTDDGLLLVDTGSQFMARRIHEQLRGWSGQRLDTAVYSHGHIDHVFGVGPFEEEAAAEGWPAPRVVAHRNLPRRFDRYVLTAGYNTVINRRQFQLDNFEWPTEYRYPDLTYDSRMDIEVGGVRAELHHARGETDDHTWTWFPDRRLLCSGDFFIWASPNAGNPQKVQRYPLEWAQALRAMEALSPETLLPGHGFPVIGAGRVSQALLDTAELLESLHDQTVALMNQGARLNEVIHSVHAPEHLLARPYLRPVYDEPEFVVRNVWRLYGGWYDGNPAHLKPPREGDLAREIAALAGGAARLAERASDLAARGELRTAGELAELAFLAAPADSGVQAVRAEVFAKRASEATSTMAKGVFGGAAAHSREHRGQPAPPGGAAGGPARGDQPHLD